MPGVEIASAVVKMAEVASKAAEVASKAAEVTKDVAAESKIIPKSEMTIGQAKEFVDGKVKSVSEIHTASGGRFADLKNDIDPKTGTNKTEKHHIPPDSASKLDRDDGPAIKMDKEDHRQTASCGNSKEAREYNAKQKDLIDQGKFREALQNDIDDIRSKFGDKYEEGISQVMEYVDKLEAEGKI